MVAVVPLTTLEGRAEAPAGSLVWSGPCPPAALAEAVCKAGLSWLITDPDGLPLTYGIARRYATGPQRAVLAVRDGGCRWPGCASRPLYTVAHHEPPHGTPGWGTDVDKMLLLCEFHHGLRHHGGWRLTLDGGATVTVTSPDRSIVRTESAAQARARHGLPATPKAGTAGTRKAGAAETPVGGQFSGPVGEPLTFAFDGGGGRDDGAGSGSRCPPHPRSGIANEARATYTTSRCTPTRPRATTEGNGPDVPPLRDHSALARAP